VQEFITEEFNQDSTQIDKWLKKWLGGGLVACEEMMKNQNEISDFCFGDHPSLADICLVPQIFSAKRFNVDLSEMPILMKIFNNCSSLKAFKDAHPENQPDAE
jgi:maleylacetoacetate isomerase